MCQCVCYPRSTELIELIINYEHGMLLSSPREILVFDGRRNNRLVLTFFLVVST